MYRPGPIISKLPRDFKFKKTIPFSLVELFEGLKVWAIGVKPSNEVSAFLALDFAALHAEEN